MCNFVVMKRKIYVASSWRNEYYPEVVRQLREAGHEVYDFRNPPSASSGAASLRTIWRGLRRSIGSN